MKRLGFKKAKGLVLECIDEGRVNHVIRDHIDVKNLLFTGQVSEADIRAVIARSSGRNYESREHHQVKGLEVHILKANGWYIKWYFLEPDSWFISVHEWGVA